MRALIIDDEQWARHALKQALESVPDIELIGEAANGAEGIALIDELQPDLIFLDVEMPAMTGFEVLAQIRAEPLVIFVTAYSEYAVQAFEAHALDYLLKPVRPERLLEAIRRAPKREAVKAIVKQARPLNKIAVRKGKRVLLISRHDILFARVEDELLFLHTTSGRHLMDRTLIELEELLEGGGFFRVSRAAIVNLESVSEMYPWLASGSWRIKLTDGAELDVSRDRARALKQLVGI